jgi:diguanylate cyclase (GGDEF)-like protein/PAS domain S-box-containing protein
MSSPRDEDRPHRFLRLARLKREVTELEEELGLARTPSLPDLPPMVESAMHRLITEHSADLLSIHAANGDYAYVSPNCEAFFGWKEEQLLGRSAYEFFHEEDLDRIAADHAKHGNSADEPRVRYRLRNAGGDYLWVETRSSATAGGDYIVCITRNINEEVLANERLRRAEEALREELSRRAYSDPLTGLPNRRAVEEALEREAKRCQRTEAVVSLVIFDVDCFKEINDRLGHHKGDEVLQQVGEVIAAASRSYDVVGRWGGDEFLVVLPETGLAEAERIAERLRQAVAGAAIPGTEGVTVSGGASSLAEPTAIDHALQQADRALYQAKHKGRNRVEAR